MSERISEQDLREMEDSATERSLVAEVRRLRGLLVGLSEAGPRGILSEPPAALAQRYGVEMALRVQAIADEVTAIKAESEADHD